MVITHNAQRAGRS